MTHVINPASCSHTHTVHFRSVTCSVTDNQLNRELVDPWVYIATQSVISWIMEGRRKEGDGGERGRWGYTGDCGDQYDLCTFGDALRKVLWAQKLLVVHDIPLASNHLISL